CWKTPPPARTVAPNRTLYSGDRDFADERHQRPWLRNTLTLEYKLGPPVTGTRTVPGSRPSLHGSGAARRSLRKTPPGRPHDRRLRACGGWPAPGRSAGPPERPSTN